MALCARGSSKSLNLKDVTKTLNMDVHRIGLFICCDLHSKLNQARPYQAEVNHC